MNWWQKLIITVVVLIFVVGGVLGGLYIGFMYAPKPAVAKQEIIVKEEAKEKASVKVEETAAPVETATVETTAKEEIAIETEVVPEGIIPEPYESEGGIPYSGSVWTCDVALNEIECLTVGPGESAGVEFKGGANPDRGGIFIFLPGKQVIRYQVSKLIEGSNWHGAYDYNRVPKENDWKLLVDDRVKAMMEAPNGTSGKGCQIVDVAVISDGSVVFQTTYYNNQ